MKTTKPPKGALKIASWLRTFVLVLALVMNVLPLAPVYGVPTASAASVDYSFAFSSSIIPLPIA